jgi:NADPH:quinone reductase-like Zn-dependent oxidoreductase
LCRSCGAVPRNGPTTLMPRRNRVDPWGDLHESSHRGLLTGNRGCLVDDRGEMVRHHRGTLWISCLTEFRGRRNLGVNSVETPRPLRLEVWSRIAGDLRPQHLDRIGHRTIAFDELPGAFQDYLDGRITGRTVVTIP